MKNFVDDLGHYACLFVLGYYTYRFFIRWDELHRFSIGHRVFGLLSFIADLLLIAVIGFAPPGSAFISFFALVAVFFTALWLQYCSRYGARINPAIQAYLNDPNRSPVTENDSWIDQYLMSNGNSSTSLFTNRSKAWLVKGAFVLLGVITFWWIVNIRAESDKQIAATQLEAARQKAASDDSIKNAVDRAFNEAIDSLGNGQEQLLNEVKGNKKLVLGVAKEQADVKAELKKGRRVNGSNTRTQFHFLNTEPRPMQLEPAPSTKQVPKVLSSPVTPKRGKRTADAGKMEDDQAEPMDTEADILARYGQN